MKTRPNTSANLPPLRWHFPLPRTHTGALLGNGIQGLMVWGETSLNITVGRAGFWDHRGGNPVIEKATFAEVRRLLEADDTAAITALFAGPAPQPGRPGQPQQIGGGRLELHFAKGLRPLMAELNLKTGVLAIAVGNTGGEVVSCVCIEQAVEEEIFWITYDEPILTQVELRLIPAWQHIGEQLAALGIVPPETWQTAEAGGFLQTLAEDPALALAWRKCADGFAVATALGKNARPDVLQKLETHADGRGRRANWRNRWRRTYWRNAATVSLPDTDLQRAWDYGLHKQAALTPPHGPAATLQGAWMEEYQIPPWSNDYHLNINLQLIYGAALPTNHPEHFAPLWDQLRAWWPQAVSRGEHFFGRPGALMIPHALDDRGQVIGAYWAGTIDHACAAWMGQFAWLHYRHTMDERILRETAWPLLRGAFEGFWAMLERVDQGGRSELRLPVSVSPEFSAGGTCGQWGANSSFQLAALHLTVSLLKKAAAVLGETPDDRWTEVTRDLPLYSTVPCDQKQPDGARRIALWGGQDLPFSHRHHSHLAAIWPFATINPFDAAHTPVVAESLQHWTRLGAGEWTGWSIPWAAMICARCGLPDAALLWLKWWDYNFTNEGYGTLHNADFPGGSAWNDGALFHPNFQKKQPYIWEVMQLDAGQAAVWAICEMLVQCADDEVRVVNRWPKRWQDFCFDRIRTEGAFLLGATVRDRKLREVRVKSLAGQPIRLRHGFPGQWQVKDGPPQTGPVWQAETGVDECYVLRAL